MTTNTTMSSPLSSHRPHRCPWWLGWLLASPLRRMVEDPKALLTPLVEPGQRVLELGPGYGFFTMTLAERVGERGRVYCVDAQQQMLDGLARRLRRRGLESRVEMRCCGSTDLGLGDLLGSIDLVVLIHVLHELEDPGAALRDVTRALGPSGRLLLIEPKGHVKEEFFRAELAIASELGLARTEPPSAAFGRRPLTALLSRQ